MALTLNHTIVPSRNKDKAARFYAQVFGLEYDGSGSHFAAVKINDMLTFDFSNVDTFQCLHYAFHLSDKEFDEVMARLSTFDIPYGSSYRDPENRQLNSHNEGRGLYFKDPDGHSLELLTRA